MLHVDCNLNTYTLLNHYFKIVVQKYVLVLLICRLDWPISIEGMSVWSPSADRNPWQGPDCRETYSKTNALWRWPGRWENQQCRNSFEYVVRMLLFCPSDRDSRWSYWCKADLDSYAHESNAMLRSSTTIWHDYQWLEMLETVAIHGCLYTQLV